jgi:hypothetical protein
MKKPSGACLAGKTEDNSFLNEIDLANLRKTAQPVAGLFCRKRAGKVRKIPENSAA